MSFGAAIKPEEGRKEKQDERKLGLWSKRTIRRCYVSTERAHLLRQRLTRHGRLSCGRLADDAQSGAGWRAAGEQWSNHGAMDEKVECFKGWRKLLKRGTNES